MLENIIWNLVECFLVTQIPDRKSNARNLSENSVEIVYQLGDMAFCIWISSLKILDEEGVSHSDEYIQIVTSQT